MVASRTLVAWALAASATSVSAAPECASLPSERQQGPCPANLPPIERIAILKTAQKQPGDESEDCSNFVPTERAVRRFFASAMHFDPRWDKREPKSSVCYAEGTFTFKNGQTAEWVLYRHGLGIFSLPGSRDASELYCIDCL